MIYSPVIIPTLNRYNHFIRCIESLENCTGANQTEVFVALDYPPSEKYIDGWKRIDAYLAEKGKNSKFRNLLVFRKNYNYGMSGTLVNTQLLREEIKKRGYDRWIMSEDDNVFSPNFLEYINKGLEIFKNNKDVFAILGYNNQFDCKCCNNNHFAQHSLFQAWGYGIWANRYIEAREELTPAYFKDIIFNREKWKRCFKYTPTSFGLIFKNATVTRNYLPQHDLNMSFYLINEHKKVICPVVSKVRNIGFDGFATTTTLDKGRLKERAIIEKEMPIDDDEKFEYQGDPFVYEEENSVNIAMWDQKWEDRFKYYISYLYKLEVYLRILRFRFYSLIGKY